MTDLEAIERRCSRRSYTSEPIDEFKMKRLNTLIEEYNTKEGLSIKFIEDGAAAFKGFNSYGMFNGVRSLIALAGKKSIDNLKEKLGYYGEFLVIEATKLNLGTCFVGGSFNKNKIGGNSFDEELICLITIGNVLEDKSFREKLLFKATHRKIKALEEFYVNKGGKLPDWFIGGVKAVQKAPSAINRQPVRIKYEDGTIYAFVDGIKDAEFMDLGIAKANFSMASHGRFEFGNYGRFIKE